MMDTKREAYGKCMERDRFIGVDLGLLAERVILQVFSCMSVASI